MQVSRFLIGLQGLADTAPCPSSEQLMGVTDCSDPCQASSAACSGSSGSGSGSYTTITTASGDYQVMPNGQIFDPNGNVVTQAQLTQVLQSTSISPTQLSNIKNFYYTQGQLSPTPATGSANISTTTLWIGGAALGLILIFALSSGGGGRRR